MISFFKYNLLKEENQNQTEFFLVMGTKNLLLLSMVMFSIASAAIIEDYSIQNFEQLSRTSQGQGKAFQRYIKNLLNDQKLLEKQAAKTHPQNIEEQAFALKTIFGGVDKNGKLNEDEVFKKLFRGSPKVRDFLLNQPVLVSLFQLSEVQRQSQILGFGLVNLSNDQKVTILQNLKAKNEFNSLVEKASLQFNEHGNRRLLITNWTGSNWLSTINDTVKASELSLPGTHDSAAYSSTNAFYNLITGPWKTQSLSFAQQLSKGVRFIDLRVKCQTGENITLYHGIVPLGALSKATTPIKNFLVSNPQQFVIILVQKQQGDLSAAACGTKFITQFTSLTSSHPRYCWGCNPGYIPTVGELRGKIWLLQADPSSNQIDFGNELVVSTCCSSFITTDNVNYFNQNYWQGPQKSKKAAALQVLNKPKSFMRFNFLSEAPSTGGSSNTIGQWATLYNTWYKNTMQANGYTQVGVIIHDFPDDATLNKTINSNP